MQQFRLLLLVLAFISGGEVMVIEIISARIYSLYYGNGIITWAFTLTFSLAALAAGYFASAKIRKRHLPALSFLLFCSCAFIVITAVSYRSVLDLSLLLPAQGGMVLCNVIITVPPLFFLAQTSPIVIDFLATGNDTGSTSGKTYAVSTAGGLIFSFLTLHLLLPSLGIKAILLLQAGIVAVAATALILHQQKRYI